jgi:NAD(P)-dependent dehydrogenase (short-subunit alcohol dehydrogenase family)
MINYELDGKVGVVTGGASGIGLACAHALARSGAAAVPVGPEGGAAGGGCCRAGAVRPPHAYGDGRRVRLRPGQWGDGGSGQ